jgi:hypothetical protein
VHLDDLGVREEAAPGRGRARFRAGRSESALLGEYAGPISAAPQSPWGGKLVVLDDLDATRATWATSTS